MPDNEKSPHVRTAPPMPTVNVRETMMMFLVRLRSIQLFTRLPIPAQAMVPNSKSIIPPNTALGMDFSNALILPTTENKIADMAAIRMTCGLVIFVNDTHPSPPNKLSPEDRRPIRQSSKPAHRPTTYDADRDLSRSLFL